MARSFCAEPDPCAASACISLLHPSTQWRHAGQMTAAPAGTSRSSDTLNPVLVIRCVRLPTVTRSGRHTTSQDATGRHHAYGALPIPSCPLQKPDARLTASEHQHTMHNAICMWMPCRVVRERGVRSGPDDVRRAESSISQRRRPDVPGNLARPAPMRRSASSPWGRG